VLRSTADLADGVERAGWDDAVIGAAREHWYASTRYQDFTDLGIASWEGLWATFEGAHPRLAGTAAWLPEYRRASWRGALRSAGGDPDAAELLSEHYISGQRAGHPVLPGAVDLVRRLAQIGPVAVVTNGPPDIQRLKIEQTGVSAYLSAVVISGELGRGKPDPGVFGHALAQIGAPARTTLMIGDSWERDVEGALASGLRAVWISHGRPVPRADGRVTVAEGPRDVRVGLRRPA
jgi:HAD superfamily hydrolase (TIGR01549 family)